MSGDVKDDHHVQVRTTHTHLRLGKNNRHNDFHKLSNRNYLPIEDGNRLVGLDEEITDCDARFPNGYNLTLLFQKRSVIFGN